MLIRRVTAIEAMAAWLAGHHRPRLAALPGRVHVLADAPLTAAERAELLASDAPDAEVALCLSISRERVRQLRARERGDEHAC